MKKILTTIAIVTGLLGPAVAQESTVERELTREEKNDALRMAYRLNGGLMNGPMVDLTDPRVLDNYARLVAAEGAPPAPLVLEPPKMIKTVVVPVDPATSEPAVRSADRAGICRRHGMRKVTTGKSWRCRR